MKISLRLLLCLAATAIIMMLFACHQDESGSGKEDLESSLIKLRTELESGLSPHGEDPFELRSFKPYLDDTWIGDAVAYSFYRAGQAPGKKGPSEAEILEDLKIIAGHWNLIRVYGADNDTRQIVELIDANELPLRVIQGIWLIPEENDPERKAGNINQVVLGVDLANLYPDIVMAVSVANETQVFWSGHKMNPENLIRYIRAVRSNVDVPVTTADDYLYWNKPESRQLADEIDFIFTHIHPLWNGKKLDEAVGWIDKIYTELQEMHPGRMVVIGETGWATDYDAQKTGPGEQGTLIKGRVDIETQAEFLIKLKKWIDSKQVTTFLFEVFDEPWKGGGESTSPSEIEKHWGVYNEDRTPKESFLRYLENRREIRD